MSSMQRKVNKLGVKYTAFLLAWIASIFIEIAGRNTESLILIFIASVIQGLVFGYVAISGFHAEVDKLFYKKMYYLAEKTITDIGKGFEKVVKEAEKLTKEPKVKTVKPMVEPKKRGRKPKYA